MNTSALTPRRVLVIDDNEAIHEDFRKALVNGGPLADLSGDESLIFGAAAPKAPPVLFELATAMQGQEGCDKAAQALKVGQPYHMAFVDMRMPPGWDGVQTIRRLWEVDPAMQVVICTAYSDYSWEQILQELGSTDRMLILKKPFDDVEVCQLATALTEKWLVTQQARMKFCEMENLVKSRTEELLQAALHDRLTGLPNRELLLDRLQHCMERTKRQTNFKYAVVFLDFDRFKVINDSLGHDMGDLLLRQISARLHQTLRQVDTISRPAGEAAPHSTAARLGGDEFILLLEGLRAERDAARVAERILAILAQPYDLNGHCVQITASIGVNLGSAAYTNPESIIRDADTAMYRAKAAGRNRYILFDQQMHMEAMARLTLEEDLRRAVANNQFHLNYQPIISLESGKVTGFEALARWQHPQRGLIAPTEFIAMAEETGLIVPLGAWVLDEACRQTAEWRSRNPGIAQLDLSVNLSRKQLASNQLVPLLGQMQSKHGIEPGHLKLEITESTIMDDAEQSIGIFKEIRRMGIRLEVDDFGTGYSSLSCLHRFPLSGLKIDRSFVNNFAEHRDYAAVIHAIVTLAHNLNMELVAEGVENAPEVVMLQAIGCDKAQGYYFAKPLEAAAFERFIRENRVRAA
jgi:diguanylate cyclase (GGDEF)-like protein